MTNIKAGYQQTQAERFSALTWELKKATQVSNPFNDDDSSGLMRIFFGSSLEFSVLGVIDSAFVVFNIPYWGIIDDSAFVRRFEEFVAEINSKEPK